MTFLNPLMLLGLAAAAIPVLIHLLNLRKLRTVEFSSLQFLKELQRSSIRRLKIRQILLLLIRTALIAFLVLAFSRPALKGPLAGLVGGKAGSCVVLILDDSPSMATRNERGQLFMQAQAASQNILDLIGPEDELHVLPLSATANPEAGRAPSTTGAARTLLNTARISPVSVTLDSAVALAVALLNATPEANREVFVITDGQATQFPVLPDPPDSAAAKLTGAYACYLLMLPPGQTENAGAGPAEILTRIVTAGRPARIRATVRNTGAQAIAGAAVSAYLDGTRMAQQSVDAGPRSSAAAEMSITPRRRGSLAGTIEIEEDAFEADNRYYFSMEIAERIRVLLAGTPESTRLARLALTLGGDSTLAGVFSVEQSPAERLDAVDLRTTDALVLCGVPSLAAGMADRVARFVADGGALLIFPGPGIDTRNYNEVLFPALGLPPAVLADPGAGTGRGDSLQDGTLRFDRVDYAHPVFDGLFDAPLAIREDRREIESPSIHQAFAARASGTGRTIIALSNGQPFLSAYRRGAGTILAFAVDPGLGWSDFAVKGVFVPLLHRSVLSASTSVPEVAGVTAGEPIEITLRQGRSSPTGVYVLLTPEGREERLVPRILPGGGLRFASQPATEVGHHVLLRKPGPEGSPGVPLITVPVNLAARESDLATAGEEEVAGFWKRSGLDPGKAVTLRSPSDIGASIREARVGVELWRHALVMALVCALLEMLIGRAPKPHGAGR